MEPDLLDKFCSWANELDYLIEGAFQMTEYNITQAFDGRYDNIDLCPLSRSLKKAIELLRFSEDRQRIEGAIMETEN